MKFDTIQEALKWFFRRPWIRPPADARSMQPIKISTSPRMENTEAVMATQMRIARILGQLEPRDFCILQNEFRRGGRTQSSMAAEYHLAGGDRSIREIRKRLVEELGTDFLREGIVSVPEYKEPIKVQHAD